MRRRNWQVRGAAALIASLPLQMAGVGQAVAASSVPFTDQNSTGSVALCGRDDKPVTAGSLLIQPFVWKAVSTTAAPARYTRAYLAVYQPIQHVDPSNWTGYAMTDVSTFTNARYPVAQSTNLDAPLLEPDRQIPPYWDGLYELRMFFTGPGQPVYNASYPTAVIRVRGNSWTLVSGGSVDCSVSQGVSIASVEANKKALAIPQTVRLGDAGSGGQSLSGGSGGAHSAAGPSPVTGGPPSTSTALDANGRTAEAVGAPSETPAAHHGGGGVLLGLATAVGAAAIMAAGSVILLVRRRRLRGDA